MAGIHSRYEANQHNDEEVRIVMVGKTGIGKSATGNTILGRYYFESKFSAASTTDECCKGKARVDGQMVAVIDTPGLFDTRHDQEKTKTDICQCISYCSPGPHIFLVVVRLGRFTEEEKQTVQTIQDIFGQAADRYSMVLFTHGDLLNDTPIEEFIRENPDLQELVRRCNGQYHIFNNTMKDRSQVTELLRKIRHIVKKNGGSHYTNEMFQMAERAIEAEKQRILREKADQIRRETEELERRLRAEYDEKLRHFMGKLQDEREEEDKEGVEMRKTREWRRNQEKAREDGERDKDVKNQIMEQYNRKLKEEKRGLDKEMVENKEEWKRREEKKEALKTKQRGREMINVKNEAMEQQERKLREETKREEGIYQEKEEKERWERRRREEEWRRREEEWKRREKEWKRREDELKKAEEKKKRETEEGESKLKRRDERPNEGLGGGTVREREEMEEGRTKERKGSDREEIRAKNQEYQRKLQEKIQELHANHEYQARQEAENNNPAIMFFKTIIKRISGTFSYLRKSFE